MCRFARIKGRAASIANAGPVSFFYSLPIIDLYQLIMIVVVAKIYECTAVRPYSLIYFLVFFSDTPSATDHKQADKNN